MITKKRFDKCRLGTLGTPNTRAGTCASSVQQRMDPIGRPLFEVSEQQGSVSPHHTQSAHLLHLLLHLRLCAYTHSGFKMN